MRIPFLVILLLAISMPAKAIQVYTILTEDCKMENAIITGVDSENFEILNFNGQTKSLSRKSIDFLVIFNLLDNPISQFFANDLLQNRMKDIYVKDKEEKLFSGWPIQFIEDLVFFYDSNGNSQVIELYDITKIRSGLNLRTKSLKHKSIELSVQNIPSSCPQIQKNQKGTLPTRILSDKIHISEFLSDLETSFERFYAYEKRTFLYPRPFLYDRDTKLGILSFNGQKELEEPLLPIYFQWSTGKEYRLQSFIRSGANNNSHLPTIDVSTLFESEVKSHIFHGVFIGNLEALAAGSEIFTSKLEERREDNSFGESIRSAAHVNYITLMGVDYLNWSFSFGPIYTSYHLEANANFREVLASSIDPALRFKFTNKDLSFHVMLSTSNREQDNPSDLDLSIDNTISTIGFVNRFEFSANWLRFHFEYILTEDIDLYFDALYLQAEYEEIFLNTNTNTYEFEHLNFRLEVAHRFGEYIRMRGFINNYLFQREFRFLGVNDSKEDNDVAFGGALEFIF